MIILKTLRWSNCFSYGADNEINLAENSLTQILGQNGMGKSSIPLILEEVLFNKNSKGVKKADIPNRALDGAYSIGLDFANDEDEYSINLSRNKTLKIELLKNGEDISSHTATNTFKTIEEILGADFKTMSQLMYQSTTSSLQFLTATDATRKKFLIDLLNLHKYTEYFEVFKEQLRAYSLSINSVDSKISTITSWLDKNDLSHMKVLTPIKLEINTEEDEEALSSLQVEFKNISETNKKVSKNNNYKARLSELDMDAAAKIEVYAEEPTDVLSTKVGSLKSVKEGIEAQLLKIEKLGDKCPTCKQQIDKEFKDALVSDGRVNIGLLEVELIELKDKITEIKANNKLYKVKKKIEQDFQSLITNIDESIPSETIHPDDLSSKITILSNKLQAKREEIAEITKENLRIERNNTKIDVVAEQTADMMEQLSQLSIEVVGLNRINTNLEILKKSFSTNGLLAYKIENLVKELELIVNEYLAELSDGRFTLEFIVVKDKLNVHITDNGISVDILSLSSGEIARVNTATLLAIRKLMNSISKSQINILFLDEIINVLDDQGKEKLVDVLIKEDKLNIFIVSHNWTHPLLSKLTIVQDKGISKVDYGS